LKITQFDTNPANIAITTVPNNAAARFSEEMEKRAAMHHIPAELHHGLKQYPVFNNGVYVSRSLIAEELIQGRVEWFRRKCSKIGKQWQIHATVVITT